MSNFKRVKTILRKSANQSPNAAARFFKTGSGDYAEKDKFIGVNVPTLRIVANKFITLPILDIQLLLESPINEERQLALFILVKRYSLGSLQEKKKIYQFYMKNLKYVNNWNLVDSSAHLIIGAHLLETNKNILLTLSKSKLLWEKRVAIVATWYFIRNDQFEWTLKIAKILLQDPHDLIHKAVGWMLREVGKRNLNTLITFLDQHATSMPRTMLRYAIEKFPPKERKAYLMQKKDKILRSKL